MPLKLKDKDKDKKDKNKFPFPKVPLMPDPQDKKEAENENEEEDKGKIRWIKLHTLLYESGVLFLTKEITRKNGNILIGLIIHLAIHSRDRDIYLYINCVGGSARTGIAIFDAIRAVPPDVNTIGCGMTAAVGSLTLLSGDMRLAFPHARVTLHKPRYMIKDLTEKLGEGGSLENILELVKYLDNTIHGIFVERTGQPDGIIREDMTNKLFMSAKEAQYYGIVDLITSEFTFNLL